MKTLKSRRKEIKLLIEKLKEAEHHHIYKDKPYEALMYEVLRFILEDRLNGIDRALRKVL